MATQQLVEMEKQWLYRQMDGLGVAYWKSEANFILFKSPVPTAAFVQRMLDFGVMVRSADVMRAKGCVRVTVGTREANEAFIAAFKYSTLKIL
jgi:histidinol-phosphate aminotransferase